MDTSARWLDPSPPGEYVTTAWIPGNYLNEGLTTVDVSIATISAPKLRNQASGRSAVAFHVQDPAEGDSARGLLHRSVAGSGAPNARVDDRGELAGGRTSCGRSRPFERSTQQLFQHAVVRFEESCQVFAGLRGHRLVRAGREPRVLL